MAIAVRKASEGDIDIIAQALLESSRGGKRIGLFDLVFNTSENEVLLSLLKRLALTSTKSYCHFSNFFVAVENGTTLGTICGYEPRIATHEIFSKALEEIGFDETYHERIAAYLLCEGDVDNKTFVLDFMLVKPEFKSIDVYKELIGKSMLTARLKGYRKVQTPVEIGSVENELIYKKLGFEVIDEKRSEYYKEQFDRSGIMRLQMIL
ncbi:MAG: acyl-CoA acyltransferase [Sulfuricurvum sp.]|uniref:acyl-CoA acyltransferase n=1 Tax=Sulfuricurvum sp. TaxID=2025608 RepID=UPI002735CBEF|nr:acyl-CoA acyltransferase [Sulfuricurvum sp.]MDP2850986.1 acyl-CoA acyltransferase [Sulfuricurvum sp.]